MSILGFFEMGTLSQGGNRLSLMICPLCWAIVPMGNGSGDAFLRAHKKWHASASAGNNNSVKLTEGSDGPPAPA